MSEVKAKDYKLPPEWIDRIFTRLTDIFKEQWTEPLKDPWRLEIVKMQWGGGLYGLTGDEIRKALQDCRRMNQPPTPMEFYSLAKRYIPPPPLKPETPLRPRNRQKIHCSNQGKNKWKPYRK